MLVSEALPPVKLEPETEPRRRSQPPAWERENAVFLLPLPSSLPQLSFPASFTFEASPSAWRI